MCTGISFRDLFRFPYKISLLISLVSLNVVRSFSASFELRNDLTNQTSVLSQDSSEARACPGCLGGSCDEHTQISGLPIVQLIAATAVGFIWAAIFIWLYANFYEGGGSVGGGGGYGYGPPPAPVPEPQYGQPLSTYNAPSRKSTKVGPARPRPVYSMAPSPSYYGGRSLSSSVADFAISALKSAAFKYFTNPEEILE